MEVDQPAGVLSDVVLTDNKRMTWKIILADECLEFVMQGETKNPVGATR
jgi:hypothetical protein